MSQSVSHLVGLGDWQFGLSDNESAGESPSWFG